MARNGSGTYVLPTGQPVVTGTTISSTVFNTLTNDLANALTTSLATDGQAAMTANLPLGGNKVTNMGTASLASDAIRYDQAAKVGAIGSSGITGAAVAGPIGASGITGAALAGALGSSGITGAAASGANNDITSLGALVTVPTVVTAAITSGASPAIRQTVFSGPVDTSGFSAFGGATGATTVTTSGTLIMTSANGLTNRQGTKVNPSWTGLGTNGTMYLYADVNADGTITEGAGTLAPIYQWGGTPVNTSGQFTYNIQQAQGFIGTGAAAPAGYRVYVGEVTVAGAVVTAITWYALMGRYDSGLVSVLALSTAYSLNHNVGMKSIIVTPFLECITTESGYAVGDRITGSRGGFDGANIDTQAFWQTYKAVGFTTVANQAVRLQNKSTGAMFAITLANWRYGMQVVRGW